jgi:polyhydroxyalkanoate synthesis regulator phasin
MAEPDNLIPTLLREMRREITERFDNVDAKLAEHDSRFRSISQALQGESLLGQFATAEFDERIQAIEKRLDAIEAQGGSRS